ncbi:methyl-accepting chemotaxis protein [Clostridium sp. DL1XJH146]
MSINTKIKSFGFNRFKIGTKLIIGFLMVSLLSVAVGIIALISLINSNERSIEIYNDALIPIKNLSTVNLNLTQIRANNIYMIYDKDISNFNERLQENSEWENEDALIMEEFEKLNLSDTEKTLLHEYNENISIYKSIREGFEESMQQGMTLEEWGRATEFIEAREAAEATLQELIDASESEAELLLDTIKESSQNATILMFSLIAIGFIFAMAIGIYLSRKISKPIKEVLGAVQKVTDGNLNVDLKVTTNDEIGAMSIAINTMIDDLNNMMIYISSISDQVAAGAQQVSDSSTSLSQGVTEQASSIQQLTASIEQISSMTKQNAENSNEAKILTNDTKKYAAQGNEQMNEMLTAMNAINQSSHNISKIIKVIDDIAFQTNILALNAAVEAARAGQHGKGFAVVAEEVRNLAARSADAAKETTALIEDSIKNVKDGTKIASTTAEALDKIVNRISKVVNLIENIAIASNEQSAGMTQVSEGINQITEVVQSTSATSQETAAASEELSGQAEMLKAQLDSFELKQNDNENDNNSSYGKEEINPEVLKMLDSMKGKERKDTIDIGYKGEISLSDSDFGKY